MWKCNYTCTIIFPVLQIICRQSQRWFCHSVVFLLGKRLVSIFCQKKNQTWNQYIYNLTITLSNTYYHILYTLNLVWLKECQTFPNIQVTINEQWALFMNAAQYWFQWYKINNLQYCNSPILRNVNSNKDWQ